MKFRVLKKRGIMLSAIEIKEKVQAMGADLVGVAEADSPLFREHGEQPEKLLPSAKSLISIGVALNRPAVCLSLIHI